MKKTFGFVQIVSLALAGVLLVATLPAPAFTLIEKPTMHFVVAINLEKAALADGGVRLAPGAYNVEVTAAADGSVVGIFKQGNTEKGRSTSKANSLTINFNEHSRQEGGQLQLHISGNTSILIGLLLPAVQKVREAAAQPH